MPLSSSRQTDAVSTRDPSSSFIKTPRQLIVVIVLSFVVPIVAIILLVQLVVSRPAADPNAMTDEAIAKRLQPIGRVEFGAASAAAGAPKLGDKAAWAPHLMHGTAGLLQSALKGKGAMPPKGGNPSLSDDDVRAAVEFMVSQSK